MLDRVLSAYYVEVSECQYLPSYVSITLFLDECDETDSVEYSDG